MDGLTIRSATAADTERIAEIIYDDPGEEATRVAGDVERAREVGRAMVRLGYQGWQYTTLCEQDGRAVGALQSGYNESPQVLLSLVWHVIRTFAPIGAARRVPWLLAQRRVNAKAPDGSFHVAELHVHPTARGEGVGGTLLDHAERQARALGYKRMALHTTVVNPARRLYERHGFRVVETRTDATYERYTGIPGRHLMVKELS